jgi:ABC-type glycerol-3-phosphate transport system substrate-binding protein
MGPFGHGSRASLRRVAEAIKARGLIGLMALGSAACSGDRILGDYPPSSCDLSAPPAAAGPRTTLSVATFWTEDQNEKAAFDVLQAGVDDARYKLDPRDMRTRVEGQQNLIDAFVNKQLPDVFQVNGGSDLLRWVEDAPRAEAEVCALDRLRQTYGWDDSYFEAALHPLSCGGRLYGLPVGIHKLNVLFYNREVFATLTAAAQERGVDLVPPEALDSPEALLTELAQVAELGARGTGGAPLVRFAIGTQEEWPLTVVAFENVLLGLGRDAYETLWMGGLAQDQGAKRRALSTKLERMVEVLKELMAHSNAETPLTWQDAVRRVGSGDALFTVTGDWGYAQLTDEQTSKVATVAFPGTRDAFVYTPDSFAVPRQLGRSGFAARAFLHDAIENPDILLQFSRRKHSIPPRRDLGSKDLEQLSSPSQRESYEAFSRCNAGDGNCHLLLAVSGLGPPPGTNHCFDRIDALLTQAVTGASTLNSAPAAEGECRTPASSADEARQVLLRVLLDIGNQPFAAGCR